MAEGIHKVRAALGEADRFLHRAQPLVEEAIRFPKGSKDLVDAFCHGALWLESRYWKAQGIQPVVTPLLVSR